MPPPPRARLSEAASESLHAGADAEAPPRFPSPFISRVEDWPCSALTGKSRRQVRLQGAVAEALRDHGRSPEEEKAVGGERWLELDVVFTNELGGPVDRHNLARRNFRRILEIAAMLQIRLYDLRHTAGTRCRRADQGRQRDAQAHQYGVRSGEAVDGG